MQKLELFDETFDPDRTDSYELSIQISLDGFSFCVKDLVRNCFISVVSDAFKESVTGDSWTKPINSLTAKYDWLKKGFKKVFLSYESPVFTIVPSGFFEFEKGKFLLEKVHYLPEFHEIKYNTLHDGLSNIYSIPSVLVSEWLKFHPKTHFIGFNESILAFHKSKSKNPKYNSITISFTKTFAIVVISKGLQLIICTSIELSGSTDTVYHLVNMCNNLDMPIKDAHIKVIGSCDNKEEFTKLLKRFFGSIEILTDLDHSHFSYLLFPHKEVYSNLFNQSLCE